MSTEVLDIEKINSDDLAANKYLEEIPEFYAQRGIIENGVWHRYQDVFDHVIRVIRSLDRQLQFDLHDIKQKNILRAYLSERIGNISRQSVLRIATLLHDIGKVDTLIKYANGTANTPGHELISAGRVNKFSERFGLSFLDEQYVERLVRYHRLIAEILILISANGDREKYLSIFRETVDDVDIELVIFMQADLEGSDMEQNDKETYDKWVSTLEWMLNTLIHAL